MPNEIRSKIRSLRLKLGVGLGVVVLLPALVVFALFSVAWLALPLALAVGVVVPIRLSKSTRDQIVALTGAVPLDPAVYPRLLNLVDGLAPSTGVAPPEVVLVDHSSANAFTVADEDGATMVVTKGLVDGLSLIELEGVVAHELAHIRQGHAHLATAVLGTVGWPALSADRSRAAGGSASLLGPLVGPSLIAIGRHLTTDRESLADVAAATVTRYPPGLAAGLERAGTIGNASGLAHHESLRSLWLQSTEPTDVSGGDTNRALAERIETLREL